MQRTSVPAIKEKVQTAFLLTLILPFLFITNKLYNVAILSSAGSTVQIVAETPAHQVTASVYIPEVSGDQTGWPNG